MLIPACLTKSSRTQRPYFFLLLTLLLTFSSCNFISNRILNKPVVQIDAFQLSAKDFSKELALRLKDLDALSAKDSKIVSVFKEQILNDFIVSCFIELWFAENKLALSPAEIDADVAALISAYSSDAEFRELLSESGLSYSDWVAKTERSLKKKKLLSVLKKDVVITKEELLSYYNNNLLKFAQAESVLLAHILVSDSSQADITKKLLVKQNFTDVAKKYSSAFNSEAKDIYGWIEHGYMPELEKAFRLRPAEIFGPITLSDGIHLFKVVEKRPYKLKTFVEAQPRVLTEVMALRETAKFAAWLDVQIKKYKIKKNLSMIDSIRIETR